MRRSPPLLLVLLMAAVGAAEPRPLLRFTEGGRERVYVLEYNFYDTGLLTVDLSVGDDAVIQIREQLDPRRIAFVVGRLRSIGLFDHELRSYYDMLPRSYRFEWERDIVIVKSDRSVYHMIYASPDESRSAVDSPHHEIHVAASRLVYQFIEYTDHQIAFEFTRRGFAERWPDDGLWKIDGPFP